jgi:hypothetical protein
MSLPLPKPIADYVAANAMLDTEAMLQPFAAYAVILADGGVHVGHTGVRALLEEAVIPVKAVFTPDTLRNDGNDVVVEGPAHGDFPGSPIRFTYRFTLANDTIQTLEITA